MKFNSTVLAISASIIAVIFWLLTDNTYDMGDSITHYDKNTIEIYKNDF